MDAMGETPGRVEYEGYLSKATKEAGFTLFGQVFALGFGFFAQAVYARLLGADLLGVFVLAWTVLMAVSILTTFGFDGGFVRYVSMYRAQRRDGEAASIVAFGLRCGMVAALLGAAVIVLAKGAVAQKLFHEPRLEAALVLMAVVIVPYTAAKLGAALLRSLKDMKRSMLGSEIWFRVPRLLLFLLLFFLGMKLSGLLVATVLACVASAAATWWFVWHEGRPLIAGTPRAPVPRREFVAYSSAMFAETATAFALTQSGRIVLGVFLTPSDVGVFNVVALLAGLVAVFVVSFNAVFSPMIADVYHRGNTALMRSLLGAITRWVLLLSLPAFAWLALSGRAVLAIFGNDFVGGHGALVVIAASQLFESAGASVASCLAMTKYQRWNVLNIAVMAIVSVVLSVLLVPRVGLLGAAVATGVATVLVNAARLIEGKLLLGVVPFDRSSLQVAGVGGSLLAAALAVGLLVEIPRAWPWHALTLLLCYGVTAGLVLVSGIRDEDRLVWSAIGRRLLSRR